MPSKAFSSKIRRSDRDSKPSPTISSPIAIPNGTRSTRASETHPGHSRSSRLPIKSTVYSGGPSRTPEETVKYLFRLLTLARTTTSDALIWRPRAPILDAFFQALGVSAERMQEQGQEAWNIKDGFLDVMDRHTSLGPVRTIPKVWFAGRDRTQRPEPVEVFVSYSAVDRPWSERLNRMLRPLEILGSARVFVDTKIVPGSGWEGEIITALDRAEVYVTFVSEHYLSSEFG